MGQRMKALNMVDNLTKWSVFNPIHELNTIQIEQAFSTGEGIPKEFYVKHKHTGEIFENFEDKLCNDFFPQNLGNRENRIYLVRGNLGVGKTSLIRYIGHDRLPELYSSVFYLDINCYDSYPANSTFEDFEKIFRILFKFKMTDTEKPYFQTDGKLAQAIFKFRGIHGESNRTAVKELDSYGMDVLIRFLVEGCSFDKILFSVDNMDDCSEEVRKLAFSFARKISNCVRNCHPAKSQNVSIVVPLRRYTNVSTDTEAYARVDIPQLQTSDIMFAKIGHARQLIDQNYQKIIEAPVRSIEIRPRDIVNKKGEITTRWEQHVSEKWLQISSVSSMFQKLMGKSTIAKKHGMLDFIHSMSGGNLKLVTKNTYNFFHSCKLNLTEMATYIYTPEDDLSFREIEASLESASFGEPIIYDLTMGIHYPFYDVDASYIPNVFDVGGSDAINYFCNTLGLIRLLCYLQNNQPVSRQSLVRAMNSIGYPTPNVILSLSKALDYCLVNTEFGTKTIHLNDLTSLELSTAGKFILRSSICNHRYLGYVCEDTPMEREYIVPIEDKYSLGESGGDRVQFHLAVRKFFSFIKKEESNELDFIAREKGLDRGAFLRNFSIVELGRPITITEYIRKRILDSTSIDLEKA